MTSSNLALPSHQLLASTSGGAPPRLALQSSSFEHLVACAALLSSGVPRLWEDPAKSDAALQGAAALGRDLGTPPDLASRGTPAAMSGPAREPDSLLGCVGRAVDRLGSTAAQVARAIEAPAASPDTMRDIAAAAQALRDDIAPVLDRVERVRAEGAAMAADIEAAYGDAAAALQGLQEADGARRQRISTLREEAEPAMFKPSARVKAAAERIAALEREGEAAARRAGALRSALGAAEPLRREAAWFQPALQDMLTFFLTLRRTLTEVGSNLNQAYLDGGASRTTGEAGLSTLLGGSEAKDRWSAIAAAAISFAAAFGRTPTPSR